MREHILVLFSKDDIASISARTKIVEQLRGRFFNEGVNVKKTREARYVYELTFDNGSMVTALPIGHDLHGLRVSHIYLCREVFDMENGAEYVEKVCIPHMVTENMYSGVKVEDRMFTFKVEDSKLNVDFYQKVVDESK